MQHDVLCLSLLKFYLIPQLHQERYVHVVLLSFGRGDLHHLKEEQNYRQILSDDWSNIGADMFYLQLWVWLDCLCEVHFCMWGCLSVCLPGVYLCTLLCVCLCSLCLISVKKLGHGVYKGGCSNYGQPHSECSVLLHSAPPSSCHPSKHAQHCWILCCIVHIFYDLGSAIQTW